jgi:SAM-dependent methyltransferase
MKTTNPFSLCIARAKITFQYVIHGKLIELYHRMYWRLKGVDVSYVSCKELGLSPETSCWHDSSGEQLIRLLKTLTVPSSSVVLDLGCGKGGATLALGKFPFSEIVGVEISADLIATAKVNVARLGLKNVHFICCDAAQFTDLDRFSHIYMYNPFPAVIMSQVVNNIADSLKRKDRPLMIIYKNPACHNVIMQSGLFRKDREFQYYTEPHPFFVYLHEPGQPDLPNSHPRRALED